MTNLTLWGYGLQSPLKLGDRNFTTEDIMELQNVISIKLAGRLSLWVNIFIRNVEIFKSNSRFKKSSIYQTVIHWWSDMIHIISARNKSVLIGMKCDM